MTNKSKPRKRAGRIVLISLATLVAFLLAFFVYTQDYYHAERTPSHSRDPPAIRQTATHLSSPDAANDTARGYLLPRRQGRETAYLPLLEQLRENGLTCVLVKMPFRLAVFDIRAANAVYGRFPSISRWYLAGHSLGGAMASSYVPGNENKLAGLILLGTYPVNDSPIPTLAIYGSEDLQLDLSKLTTVANQLEIQGGNHAYFGNYGEQTGDGTAAISREEQQAQAVTAILAFVQSTLPAW